MSMHILEILGSCLFLFFFYYAIKLFVFYFAKYIFRLKFMKDKKFKVFGTEI